MGKSAKAARAFTLAITACLAMAASGASPSAADAPPSLPIEGMERVALMAVEAQVMIETTGEVSQVRIDTKIAPSLAERLQHALLAWHFEPIRIAGEAQRVNTRVVLTLAAVDEGGSFKVSLDDVYYPDNSNPAAVLPDGESAPITGKYVRPPEYPQYPLAANAMGGVLLAIRVTPEGRVGEVMVVRSQLYEFDRATKLTRRSVAELEMAAVNAARHWRFNVPPSRVSEAEAGDMTVTVPVHFSINYPLDAPGQWLSVQRSPTLPIRWLPDSQARSGLGLAGSGGGSVSQFGAGPKLLQDVVGSSLQ